MPTITFISAAGAKRVVEANPGDIIMRVALAADVPGILAECGGAAMCATCHVYVAPESASEFVPVTELENEMLDCTVAERLASSRLSCQLTMPACDITVEIPPRQT